MNINCHEKEIKKYEKNSGANKKDSIREYTDTNSVPSKENETFKDNMTKKDKRNSDSGSWLEGKKIFCRICHKEHIIIPDNDDSNSNGKKRNKGSFCEKCTIF